MVNIGVDALDERWKIDRWWCWIHWSSKQTDPTHISLYEKVVTGSRRLDDDGDYGEGSFSESQPNNRASREGLESETIKRYAGSTG